MTIKNNLIQEYRQVIDVVTDLLQKNKTEWSPRYQGYQELIGNLNAQIADMRKKFRALDPVFVYLSISKVKTANASRVSFDLRYEGQSVAELIVNKTVSLKVNPTQAENNVRDFGFPGGLNGKFDWYSKEAMVFRKFFSGKPQRTQNATQENTEHRFESVILTDLLKRISSEKTLVNIRPVLLCGARFQMPTPLSASNAKSGIVTYAGKSGGGIDILARAGKSGRKTNLCVIEVKDENTVQESPQKAMNQAIAYAAFIWQLLRDKENGPGWWKLFGFSGSLPTKLSIITVVAMPKGDKDQIYPGEIIKIGANDELVLQYIYIDGSTGQPISTTYP